MQEHEDLDPTNLENLKAKQDGIKFSIQKKIGMTPTTPLHLSASYRGAAMTSQSNIHHNATSITSYFTKNPSFNATPHSVWFMTFVV